MNPFDALIDRKTPEQRREWMEPVKRNGTYYTPEVAAYRKAAREAVPWITKDEWRGRDQPTRGVPFLAGALVATVFDTRLIGVLAIDFYEPSLAR